MPNLKRNSKRIKVLTELVSKTPEPNHQAIKDQIEKSEARSFSWTTTLNGLTVASVGILLAVVVPLHMKTSDNVVEILREKNQLLSDYNKGLEKAAGADNGFFSKTIDELRSLNTTVGKHAENFKSLNNLDEILTAAIKEMKADQKRFISGQKKTEYSPLTQPSKKQVSKSEGKAIDNNATYYESFLDSRH